MSIRRRSVMRIDMLTTGVRTPVGGKVFGRDLTEIERISLPARGVSCEVPALQHVCREADGREYIDVIPDREAIARYGLTVRDA